MRYLIAFILLLLTTKSLLMISQGLSALYTDYAVIPHFVEHFIETHGAENYLTQLMAEHRSHLRSIELGVVFTFGCAMAWRWWRRRFFASESS